jgi:hypothetical protein
MKNSPTLRIHAHWQVAQTSRTSQNLPKSMAAPTLTEKKMKKHGHTTLCISNSGFNANLKRKTINQRSELLDSLVG